jgi:hypothetical protein
LASKSNLHAAVEAMRAQISYAWYANDYVADQHLQHIRARIEDSRNQRIATLQGFANEASRELVPFVMHYAPGLASAPWSEFANTHDLVQPANPLTPPWLRVCDMDIPTPPHSIARITPFLDAQNIQFNRGAAPLSDALPSVAGLLLRTLATTQPGDVQVRVYDPEGLGSSLSWIGALVDMGLAAQPVTDNAGLVSLLEEASKDIADISGNLLQGIESVAAASQPEGRRIVPWKILVLLGEPEGMFSDSADRLLSRVAGEGARHGIHIIRVVTKPSPLPNSTEFSTFGLDKPKVQGGPDLSRVAVQTIAAMRAYMEQNAPSAKQFLEVQEMARGQIAGVATGIHLPLGVLPGSGAPALAVLNDQTPHAMLMGPSGTGKTQVIHTIVSSVMASYTPAEVQVLLLDMKETRDFTRRYGAFDGNPAVPHVSVLGSTHDVEYGESLLRWLIEEVVRRNKADGSNYASLRAASAEPPPRLLVIIDEFQNLFPTGSGNAGVVAQNVALMVRLAREARSAGVHLLLSTQTISGVDALTGTSNSLLNQFQLRIALPRAAGVLDYLNDGAETLPEHHAIINHAGGLSEGNVIAHIIPPTPSERSTLLEAAVEQTPDAEQQFFEGRTLDDPTPVLDSLSDRVRVVPSVFAGKTVALTPEPLLLPLRRGPGGNIAVVGNRDIDGHNATVDVMLAGVAGLIQTAEADAEFHVVPVHFESAGLAARIHAYGTTLDRNVTVHQRTDLTPLLTRLSAEVSARTVTSPVYVILLGMDAASNLLSEYADDGMTSGKSAFESLLKHGPDYGVHMVAWWRQGARMEDTFDTYSTKGVFGGWIFMSNEQSLGYLDVHEWTNPDTRVLVRDVEQMPWAVKAIPAGPINEGNAR